MPKIQDLLLYLEGFNLIDLLDLGLVIGVIYGFLYLLRGTQAVQLVRGLLIVSILIYLLASELELTAFSWLVERVLPALVFVIPVLFQQEIRRALERLGRAGFLFSQSDETQGVMGLRRVSQAAQRLSDAKMGALIVFERESGLQDIIESGVPLDSRISADLLVTIFFDKTPLHDGAVIIRDDRIVAAAAVLPLATDVNDRRLGTRHRAAIGVTQVADAISVVVSEETGNISLAFNGRLIRNLDEERLLKLLRSFYVRTEPETFLARFQGRLKAARRGEERP
ncbi:MAG: diadenylate cyclase CdaA [Anaerolineales bacterium]|nr:diadenylate cyclase CdaA [Anaerolineales bacterium]MCB9126987.1 TIGR00159 family protein [Ardenticatenales bacterium]